MSNIPTKKTGLSRVMAAFFYSVDGIKIAWKNEAAFRQELWLVILACIALFLVPFPPLWKALLFFATLSVLIVELLNSAVEAIVDLASPEFHLLAKHAKDLGSAAVLISIMVAAALWLYAVYLLLE